jgi:hypothetical protein
VSTRLVDARRQLLQEIGGGGTFFASGGTATTLICPTAFQSTELPSSALAYAWIFLPTTIALPRQRRVKAAGLDPATGTITVDAAFPAPVVVGQTFEIHSRLPAAREPVVGGAEATVPGLLECLNLGLRHLLVPDTYALALVSGQYDYSLPVWLDRPARLLDVRQLAADGLTKVSTWHGYELREDAEGPTLHFEQPYRFPSGSFSNELLVHRPADTKTLVGGVWVDAGVVGVTNETDEAPVDMNDWITVALVFAYDALRKARTGTAKARYEEIYQAQLADARKLRRYDTTNDIETTTAPAPSAGAAA